MLEWRGRDNEDWQIKRKKSHRLEGTVTSFRPTDAHCWACTWRALLAYWWTIAPKASMCFFFCPYSSCQLGANMVTNSLQDLCAALAVLRRHKGDGVISCDWWAAEMLDDGHSFFSVRPYYSRMCRHLQPIDRSSSLPATVMQLAFLTAWMNETNARYFAGMNARLLLFTHHTV